MIEDGIGVVTALDESRERKALDTYAQCS